MCWGISRHQTAHLTTVAQCLGVSMSRILDQQSIFWIGLLFKNEVLNGGLQLLLVWIYQKLHLKTIIFRGPLHLSHILFDSS